MLRVLWKCPPTRNAELRRSRDEPVHLCRHGDADRVAEEKSVGLGGGDLCCDLEDPALVDRALERAPEGHAHRHRGPNRVGSSALDDSHRRVQRLSHRGVLVPLVERLRGAEGEANLVQSGSDDAVVSPIVQRKSGVDDAVDPVEARNHLLRAGHLRHPSRIDEARHFHGSDAGSHELADELDADIGSEDVRLVLEPVARADVDDEHAGSSRRARSSSGPARGRGQ